MTQVQNYQLLKEIGSGSYSIVYRAEDIKTKQIVAIKKMKELARNDEVVVQNQIDLLKKIDHKNIIRYITDFKENQIWYIVFEYCGKGDMEKFSKKQGKLPEAFTKSMIFSIMGALAVLHEQKIVHRDLKLANILINQANDFKLADFGFSKNFEEEWMRSFCGTPYAMAPQILKLEQYDQRCDTWSLGIMCYQLLYGILPFNPGKKYGHGMHGLSNCVLNAKPFFDPNVNITEQCYHFINLCLIKQKQKRPFIKQLLNHKWFKQGSQSRIGRQLIDSLSGVNQSAQKAEEVFNGSVQEHIQKLVLKYNLNQTKIKSYIQHFDKFYPQKQYKEIRAMIFLMIMKIIKQLQQCKIQIEIQEKTFEVPLKDIKSFQKHILNLKEYLTGQIKKNQKQNIDNKKKKINIQRSLIRFLTFEAVSCLNATQNYPEKRALISYISVLPLYKPVLSKIAIQWSYQKEQPNSRIKFCKCIEQMNNEQIQKIINQQLQKQDLHTNWLIQHYFENQSRSGSQNWIGDFIMNVIKLNENKSIGQSLQLK